MRRWAILDSGASSHFLIVGAPILHKKRTANPIKVTVANGEQVQSTHDGALDIPGLPPGARYAHVIPGIKHSLLSIVRLCNAGCEIVFGRWGLNVEVRYRGKMVLRGNKSTINGLWYVPITDVNSEDNHKQADKCKTNPDQQGQETATQATQRQVRFQANATQELPTTTHQEPTRINQMKTQEQLEAHSQQIAANAITQVPTMSRSELAMFHHQALGNPRKDTLLRALKRHPDQFATFPGLNWDLIKNHLPPSGATDKGHMIMTRKGLKSTRTITRQITRARKDISNFLPTEEVCMADEDELYCYAVLGDKNERTIYSDLTGRFPVESYDGKNYIFIAYAYKLNSIFMIAMKDRENKSMIAAYEEVYAKLEARGQRPTLHILDNECSKCIQNFLEKKGTRRHHVAPHSHRVNAAEPAVKTAKYHLIAALATLDWGCPVQLWSKMLKQVQDTLNMFRTSRNNTAKTAYQELEGNFDWNATPMAPLGTKGSVFIHPDNRNTFATHCDEGFTVGRAPHHYRLLEFYIPATRGYRLSGTYRLYPQHCRMTVIT